LRGVVEGDARVVGEVGRNEDLLQLDHGTAPTIPRPPGIPAHGPWALTSAAGGASMTPCHDRDDAGMGGARTRSARLVAAPARVAADPGTGPRRGARARARLRRVPHRP